MVSQSSRRFYLWGSLVVGIILASSYAIPAVALLNKLFVDHLLPGNSFTKTYLFLAFSSGTLAWWAWAPYRTGRTYLKRFFFLSLLLLTVGLLEQLWFTSFLGVGSYEGLAVYGNYEYASTRIEHIHLAKAALGQWLPSVSNSFDAGVPFVRYFPRPWLLAHFSLMFLNFVFLMLALSETRNEAPSRRASASVALYILGLHTIDGGLLSPSCIVAIMFFLHWLWDVPYWKSILAVMIPAMLSWIPAIWPVTEFVYRFAGSAFLLSIIETSIKNRRKGWHLIGCAIALLATLTALPWIRLQVLPDTHSTGIAWNVIRYATTPLSRGQRVSLVKVGEMTPNSLVRVMDSQHQGPYSLYTVELLEPTTVYRLSSDLGLHLQRFPINVNGEGATRLRVKAFDPEQPDLGFVQLEKELPAGSLFNFSLATLGKKPLILKDFEFY